MRSLLGMSAALIGLVSGCLATADDRGAAVGDEEDVVAPVDEAVPAAAGFAYYAVTADARKCPSPMCGGWFLKALNRQMTKCYDTAGQSCYVSNLDFALAGLSDDDQGALLAAAGRDPTFGAVYAIVRGTFAAPGVREAGRFAVTEGWLAESDAPSSGVFVRVTDNGLRCLRAPCPSITEETLNTASQVNIAAMDFTRAQLTSEQITDCTGEMALPGGILVAGSRFTVYDAAAPAKGRTVTAAYGRLGK